MLLCERDELLDGVTVTWGVDELLDFVDVLEELELLVELDFEGVGVGVGEGDGVGVGVG